MLIKRSLNYSTSSNQVYTQSLYMPAKKAPTPDAIELRIPSQKPVSSKGGAILLRQLKRLR